MARIREEFYRQEEISRLDPEKMQVRFMILNTYEDPASKKQI